MRLEQDRCGLKNQNCELKDTKKLLRAGELEMIPCMFVMMSEIFTLHIDIQSIIKINYECGMEQL